MVVVVQAVLELQDEGQARGAGVEGVAVIAILAGEEEGGAEEEEEGMRRPDAERVNGQDQEEYADKHGVAAVAPEVLEHGRFPFGLSTRMRRGRGGGKRGGRRKQEPLFLKKKEAKKLFLLWDLALPVAGPAGTSCSAG
jgi:hypothetical protein